MKKPALIGMIVLLAGGSAWLNSATIAQGDNPQPTPAERLRTLEFKMANLEKVLDVRLDDEAAIAQLIYEQELAQKAAGVRSMISVLQTVRSQMELYQVQHKGEYPDLSKGWAQLTAMTNTEGKILRSESEARWSFGPYLQAPPTNFYTESHRVITRFQDAGPDAGWYYEAKTGTIKAVVPRNIAREFGLHRSDVVVY